MVTYEELLERIGRALDSGRDAFALSSDDISAARLYCAAFRVQTVGLFDAAARRAAERRTEPRWYRVYRIARRLQSLGCLTTPDDARAALGLFHQFSEAVEDLIEAAKAAGAEEVVDAVGRWLGRVRQRCGLWVGRCDELDPWSRYKVPGLEVEIVPLVYLDHLSWNVAVLGPGSVGKTVHYHRCGVEIHLGFSPLQGVTILGDAAAPVEEGYAMPIPAGVPHGFDLENTSQHRLPFIFGSAVFGGWGMFADVVPRWQEHRPRRRVDLEDRAMNGSLRLERALAAVAEAPDAEPRILVDASSTRSGRAGALELRARSVGKGFRDRTAEDVACFLYQGRGRLRVGPVEASVREGDHWGVLRGMEWEFEPAAGEVGVLLEAVLTHP